MKLGVGKLPDDALLFATIDGAPLSTIAISKAWAKFAASVGLPDVTFHGLRHTHASQLIDGGRYRHHQQAPWSRQAGHHPADLRACVSEGRQQGSSRYQCGAERLGCQSGAIFAFCSFVRNEISCIFTVMPG